MDIDKGRHEHNMVFSQEGFTSNQYPFSENDFQALADLVNQKTGIVLKSHKKNLMYGRLTRRLRKLGLTSFGDYLQYLNGSQGEAEITSLINAITTNLTKFFRESHHYAFLEKQVLPNLSEGYKNGQSPRLRIWSAGCSSGEEAYSISLILERFLTNSSIAQIDAKILATDIDTRMLNFAHKGIYDTRKMEKIDQPYDQLLSELPLIDQSIHMPEKLRERIYFKKLNLLEEWPVKGPFDCIFCRNVMIYFDRDTKKDLVARFTNLLSPNGYLFIGHSENLLGEDHNLKLLGRSIYQRV